MNTLTNYNTINGTKRDAIVLLLAQNHTMSLGDASAIVDVLASNTGDWDLYGDVCSDATMFQLYGYDKASTTPDLDDVLYDVLGSSRWRTGAQDIEHHIPYCVVDGRFDHDGSWEDIEDKAGDIWEDYGRTTDAPKAQNLMCPWAFKQHEDKCRKDRKYHGIRDLIFNKAGDRRSVPKPHSEAIVAKRKATIAGKKTPSQKRLERLQKRFASKM